MNKNKIIAKLTNILSISLRHKIGSIVNESELYAQKYAKDAEIFLNEASKILFDKNWDFDDKILIKRELERKLKSELEKKSFLREKKFDIMDKEIEIVLKLLNLWIE